MQKNLTLHVNTPLSETQIIFDLDFVLDKKFPKIIKKRKTAIITDDQVKYLYGQELKKLKTPIFSFPGGENAKTRKTKEELENQLLSSGFSRDSCVIGFGGGVVGDVVGFLASTYCRGISFIQVPTTLLAMIDAAIGGKTGVNTPYAKNMIGTFYHPEEILIDGSFLLSLPKKQIMGGIVEMLKIGLLQSFPLFEKIRNNMDKIRQLDLSFLMDLIYETVLIKRNIVMSDPYEKLGLRRVLNLGHTFAHAFEQLENYQIAHGEAVAMGILISCFLSEKMGFLPKEARDMVHETLCLLDLPMQLERAYQLQEILPLLSLDKKSINGYPKMVFIKEIGKVEDFGGRYCTDVCIPHIEQAIVWMNKQFVKI